LSDYCHVLINDSSKPPTADEIISRAYDAFGLCISVRDYINKEIIEGCKKLKVISSMGCGYDNIDIEAASKKGVYVCCIRNPIAIESVADLTWTLLLGLARKVVYGDLQVRNGKFEGWNPRNQYGLNIYGKTLGIIGMGMLGQAVARRAMGFRMQVLYYDPVQCSQENEKSLNLKYVSKDYLLKSSDYICICSPLSVSTYHQIGRDELSIVKPTSLLINTSRGSEVDENAVADALESGIIGGYAADVYEMEEKSFYNGINQIPARLLALSNQTLFSPHAATAPAETRLLMASDQAQAIVDTFKEEIPSGIVNLNLINKNR
jgi:lactate dehydrogenase-like 2-hydroxyacid dehydrogenase